ncbi:MAG: hypothetical protein ABI759_08130 [Candidatus Solibacter sp.]
MACQLAPDPTGTIDFITSTGAKFTVIVKSASGTACIVAATLNGTPQTVANCQAPVTAVAARNNLDLALVGSDPMEDFEIHEDCGDATHLMRKGNFQNGPTIGFRIHAF